MRKFSVLVLFVVSLFILNCRGPEGRSGPKGEGSSDVIAKMINATAKYKNSILDIECTDGVSFWRGTGSFVTGGKILTAHHVVAGAMSCEYYNEGGFVGSGASGLYNFGGLDMVLITPKEMVKTDLIQIPYTTNYQVTVGEPLLLLSLPLDINHNVQSTFGYVTDDNVSSEDLGTWANYWRGAFTSDMVASSGSSGASVFNGHGIIFAIHVGGYDYNLDLNYQLPIQ